MTEISKIRVNENGGFFSNGEAFCTAKWVEIITVYNEIVEKDGKCSCRHLASECHIPIKQSMLLSPVLCLCSKVWSWEDWCWIIEEV